MCPRYEPKFLDPLFSWFDSLSDEKKIRLEAILRNSQDHYLKHQFGTPTFEEMRMDGDRGL